MEELDEEMIQFEKDHPSRPSGNGGGSMKTLAIVLGVVAAALLAALIWMLSQKNALVKDLNIDKQNLTNELIELQGDYDAITTTNAALNDSLAVEKEKVGQLIPFAFVIHRNLRNNRSFDYIFQLIDFQSVCFGRLSA